MTFWAAPSASRVRATLTIPGSKSLTNRYLLLAAIGREPVRVINPLVARDTLLMAGALEALGARIEQADGVWTVTPIDPSVTTEARIDVGLAGTVMRFIPPLAALRHGITHIDGDEAARARPMSTIVNALRALGAQIDAASSPSPATDSPAGAALPLTVVGTGEIRGGRVEIDASASSQFVSALLLAGPLMREGIDLRHVGERLPSLPHIEMTIRVLREAGIAVTTHNNRWVVSPGVPALHDVAIEPDLSNAGPFLAAAMVTGGEVTINHWPACTTQAGDRFRDLFAHMGGHVTWNADTSQLTLRGPAEISPIDVDMHDVGELVPTLAAVCAFACGQSRLRDIGQLRGHETDRLAALVTELGKVGVEAWIDGDDLVISPTATPRSADLASYADHRMATFGAILGLRTPGIRVENIATTSKTLPGFTDLWQTMIGATS